MEVWKWTVGLGTAAAAFEYGIAEYFFRRTMLRAKAKRERTRKMAGTQWDSYIPKIRACRKWLMAREKEEIFIRPLRHIEVPHVLSREIGPLAARIGHHDNHFRRETFPDQPVCRPLNVSLFDPCPVRSPRPVQQIKHRIVFPRGFISFREINRINLLRFQQFASDLLGKDPSSGKRNQSGT